MAQTPSNMLQLGTALPSISLKNAIDEKMVDVQKVAEGKRGILVLFICNHCPFVIHIRSALIATAHEAMKSGFAVVAINSNSVESHPQDGPTHMAELAKKEQWQFPFLYDETQEVARAFLAACTPDLFLFDGDRRLAYRGRFDESTPGNGKPVTGVDLKSAIDAIASGRQPNADQKPSIGCNIKWK